MSLHRCGGWWLVEEDRVIGTLLHYTVNEGSLGEIKILYNKKTEFILSFL